MTQSQFSTLPLTAKELSNLKALNYSTMTAIQAKSLPIILQGNDLLAQAKTGSGKTAAFGIALLHQLTVTNYQTEALILCPTRELADQVSKELRRLARAIPNTKITTLCGGTPIGPQFASLEYRPHIVVGTPGRVLKHLNKGSLKLNQLKTLVLDEADRMLDMGFSDDIHQVIAFTPDKRQTLLFSATYPKEIKTISRTVQNKPIDVRVETQHQENQIEQHFYEVAREQRESALLTLLHHYQPKACVIFCNRKQQCQDIADLLSKHKISAKALHGDLEQRERDQVLTQFANQSCSILIATDVASRGLDIKELPMVINYELSPDPEVHVHRIGRTGRAGHSGIALSLFQPSEARKIIAIEDYLKISITPSQITELNTNTTYQITPPMVTLCINGGRKDKLRAGDILGALTASKKIQGANIGKIDLFDYTVYVAVEQAISTLALQQLLNGKIKGRKFKARIIK
ncbi:ATP-dependent RNA helicase DbpA [Aliikangiella sp. IMCC44359]|uniref:ATP-dependent RNA helicase DbpA n=1 Tax=Aliikangiella sp. IMCC44359 TaxID=3459125 RepID=UPI00403AE47B